MFGFLQMDTSQSLQHRVAEGILNVILVRSIQRITIV